MLAAGPSSMSGRLSLETEKEKSEICRTLDGKVVCSEEKKQQKGTITECTPGHNFLIIEKEGSPQPDVKVIVGDTSVVKACRSSTPETKKTEVRAAFGQTAAVPAAMDQCKEWRCAVEYCVPSDVSGKKEMICKKIPTSYAPKERVDEKKLQEDRKDGLTSMYLWGDSEQRETAKSVIQSDSSLSAGVLDSFSLLRAQYTNEAITTQQEINAMDQTLEMIAQDKCVGGTIQVSYNNSNLPRCADENQIRADKAAAEQRLKFIEATQQYLENARVDLQATAPGTSDEDTCATNPAKCSRCVGVNCGGARYLGGGYDTFGNGRQQMVVHPNQGAYASDQYREQLYAACQAGNSAACQEYLGRTPPGSTYGMQGQQCGSSNTGAGGLIGTIISLFKKDDNNNNNNCVNGVPRPQCNITASPQNILTAGQAVQLSWQSQNAFSASLSNAGNVPTQGNMTVNPQTSTTYTMFVQGYRDNTGQQVSGQCQVQVTVGQQGGPGPDPNTAPKAQISCSPQLADVGMSVAISYACTNAAASGGTGFSTNNQMSGSATPKVEAPTIGSNTVTYGLTCSKEGKTDTAQCTVEINKPTIVLIANPKNVESGKEANIGWVTGGMEECVISSPTLLGFTAEHASNTSPSGVAKTPPLTQDTKFILSCTTKAGGTKTAETTVEVGN